ncbi:MAG: glycosyltransferase, partial [Candidatus Aenigmarchaeota archaeon]|nr:glycosyltransferase [Candidatus Aenigmarchaeota archaeon]
SKGIKSAFIQATQTLIAIHNWGWESVCYCFPGVSNPLKMPRYRWGKLFADIYEKKLFSVLANVDTILASADDEAIADLVNRSCEKLTSERVIKFPTRVDTDIFKPLDKITVRDELGINQTDNVIVSCGRLNIVKGWDFLLHAFKRLSQSDLSAKLVFVGDGEDRQKLHDKIQKLEIEDSVKVTGFVGADTVVKYINASNLCVVGSHNEGWSVAMLEALACGKPIVSTNVSGAKDMIRQGQNGFVVEKRNSVEFAKAMEFALMLENSKKVSLSIAENYALKNLAKDLGRLWKPLS